MRTREDDIKAVQALRHMGNCQINWSEGGGGDVYRVNNMLMLFYVPQYDGPESFERTFELNEIEALVDLAHSWA